MSARTGSTDRDHPITAAVAHIEAELDRVADAATWSLDGAGSREALLALTHASTRLAELQLRVLAQAVEVKAGEETGATSTANWWAHTTRMTRSEAYAHVRAATSLSAHEPVRAAMAAGDVLPQQAKVICDAVDALPSSRAECGAYLIGLARDHDAKSLKILGKHVLAVIDPDAGDAHEAKTLADEEARADKATRFSMHDDGDGQCHGRFTMPAWAGAMLKKALMAYAAPKHVRATGAAYDHENPTPHRWGQAFVEYIQRYPVDKLPKVGGLAATVVVTIPLAVLEGRLAACSLDTGHRIPPGLARRLLCESGALPMVVDGESQILDVGRTHRFHTPAQRLALTIEQDHCQHPGCDVPAAFCHVHHTRPWAHGGDTNLADAQLLCPRHHHQVHAHGTEYPLRT